MLVLVGAVGGLLSGMFGVGGGILMVPLLMALAGLDQRRAAATSLAAIAPTAVVGAGGYLAEGRADLVVAALVAVGGIAGSWIGTWLLRRLPLALLRWLFVGLLVVVAWRMLATEPPVGRPVDWGVATAVGLVAVGLAMGVSAGLFGIGGGVIVVPALVLLIGADSLVARGTSLLVMVPTSLAGTFANARAGMLRLQDGAVVGVAAAAASLPGVALAFWVPARLGNALFAVLVLVTAAQLSWRAFRLGRRPDQRD